MRSIRVKQDINKLSIDKESIDHYVSNIFSFFPSHHIDLASSVAVWLVGRSQLVLLGSLDLIVRFYYLPTLVLVVLLCLLSSMSVFSRGWWVRTIPHLMLRASIAITYPIGITLTCVVPWLPSMQTVVIIVVTPLRLLALTLKVVIFSLVPLPFIPSPLILVFILLPYCPLHINSCVVHILI